MLTYRRLHPGRGFSPAHAACYYAQRLVPIPWLRRAIASGIARGINLRRPRTTRPGEAAQRDIASGLRTDGYAIIPNQLAAWQIDEMRTYLDGHRVVLRGGGMASIDSIPKGTTIADYRLETVLNCPHLLALMNAPCLIGLAKEFLGCAPTISTVGIRWSFPGARMEATTQGFHRDTDDWRFFKFFTYLTDVDKGCGPHLYVRGSHRTAGTFRAVRIEDATVERRYGRDAVVTITGPRGTSFVADTYGIHAGPIPTAAPRLMVEVGYSVLPVFAIRYRPVALERPTGVDPYINRLLLAAEPSSERSWATSIRVPVSYN